MDCTKPLTPGASYAMQAKRAGGENAPGPFSLPSGFFINLTW
jgi:hypothetical protein